MVAEVRLNLRLPAELHTWLVEEAAYHRRSLNSQIVRELERSMGLVVDDLTRHVLSPAPPGSTQAPLAKAPKGSRR